MPADAPPIVIAGAGPVGLSLALGLARRGVKSVVLEQKLELSTHSKAVVVGVRSMEIFHEWGLADTFKEASEWVEEITLHDSTTGKEVLGFSFETLRPISATPGACVIPQSETERLLYEACVASAMVEVRFGHSVTAFDSGETGVRVRVQSGDSQYVLESEYLCGCDGAHSSVRGGLGLKLEGKTYNAHAILADVLIEDQRDRMPWPRSNIHVRSLSAAVRMKPGHWRLIFAQEGSSDEVPPADEFVRAKLEELIAPGPMKVLWSSKSKIHCRNSPHFRVGRVLLLGDAAHLNSPAGGQGMNAGIQDAHNLAWKLASALNGFDAELLLKSYDDERYDAMTHSVDVATDRLTRVGILAPLWFRSLVLAIVKLLIPFRAIQRRMAGGAGMLNLRYDQSDLIDTSGGRYLPDVDLGDGVRLRAALGLDGGVVELAQSGRKLFLGEATYELSGSASAEMGRAGGPFFAVRPDHVIAYSGGSREQAEAYVRFWRLDLGREI
ncbi:MAG: FAD-dependent oxidoreductase [Fimbriimonadales bacterium]